MNHNEKKAIQIKSFIETLESHLNENMITKEDYDRLLSENKKKLEKVEKKNGKNIPVKTQIPDANVPVQTPPADLQTVPKENLVPSPDNSIIPNNDLNADPQKLKEEKKDEKKEKKLMQKEAQDDNPHKSFFKKVFSKKVAQKQEEEDMIEKLPGEEKKEKPSDKAKAEQPATSASGTAPSIVVQENYAKETDLDNLRLALELLKGETMALKEYRESATSRITTLAEEIGAMRAMLLEREKTFKSVDVSMQKIEGMMEELKPEVILNRLSQEETKIEKAFVGIDQVNNKLSETDSKVKHIQEFTDKVKNLESIINIANEVDAKVKDISGTKRHIEEFSSKIEAQYIEFTKRLKEFDKIVTDVDRIESLSKDMSRGLDMAKVRIDEKASAEEIREEIRALRSSIVDELSGKYKDLEAKLTNASSRLDEISLRNQGEINVIKHLIGVYTTAAELEEAKKKKEQIGLLLKTIEEQMSNGMISKESYEEMKKQNETELAKLERNIRLSEEETVRYNEMRREAKISDAAFTQSATASPSTPSVEQKPNNSGKAKKILSSINLQKLKKIPKAAIGVVKGAKGKITGIIRRKAK